jgi:hypothetical protein
MYSLTDFHSVLYLHKHLMLMNVCVHGLTFTESTLAHASNPHCSSFTAAALPMETRTRGSKFSPQTHTPGHRNASLAEAWPWCHQMKPERKDISILHKATSRLHLKWHPILDGPWSKAVHYKGYRVVFGTVTYVIDLPPELQQKRWGTLQHLAGRFFQRLSDSKDTGVQTYTPLPCKCFNTEHKSHFEQTILLKKHEINLVCVVML